MTSSSRPKRVLFVVNDAEFFLSHRLCLARAARDEGHDVRVATPESAKAADLIAREGFQFHAIPLSRRSLNPWRDLRTFVALYRLYRAVRPDLVHHVTIKPVLYGGIATRLAAIPAVVNALTGLGYLSVAGGWQARVLRPLVWGALRGALGHANARLILQNSEDRAEMIKRGVVTPANSVVIKGSGVDVAEFTPRDPPGGPATVLFASRMLWHKGVREFVDAARALRRQGVAARFVMVGDTDEGNPSAVPREQLQTWHDGGTIEWWGQRSDMPAVLAQAHIVCLPSGYGEGVPKVLIEAAACARPVVATDRPGCREIVRHEQNGLLVAPKDGAALAASLRRLIDDPQLCARLGARGRQIVEAEFSEAQVIRETLAVYRDLLAKTAPGIGVQRTSAGTARSRG